MEKEALHILLKGDQPIIICPARGLEGMRIPARYRKPMEEGRLLLLSPFEKKVKRQTAKTAGVRNKYVAKLAETILFIHAEPDGKLDKLCEEMMTQGKDIYALPDHANEHLFEKSVKVLRIEDIGSIW